jgi:GWxTD domain-containing protein
MKIRLTRLITSTILVAGTFFPASVSAQTSKEDMARNEQEIRIRAEESQDYYENWLKADVAYIATGAEKDVFNNLTTPEEKEQFIEQFWIRRDVDRRTSENEYKTEHYRRIAYANERFASGRPGWMSDRGRIFIIHGDPAEIEAHPNGGWYMRPQNEGGGYTVAYPFEIWRYHYIEGVGDDVMLEFVDPSMSGEYRLTHNYADKDAFLFTPGAGMTDAEAIGGASRGDRPYFTGDHSSDYLMSHQTERDNPFRKYETFALAQRPSEYRYDDLKQLVEINVSYNSLPVTVTEDYFRITESQSLVPLNIHVENKNLTFQQEGGLHVARLSVYGIVTSMTNRVVTEFEDDLMTAYSTDELLTGLRQSSIYQKILPLKSSMRYKVDIVIKDVNSEKIGVIRRALIPPKNNSDQLSTSSIIFSDYLRILEDSPDPDEMFVIGDVKIRPKIDGEFSKLKPFSIYFHLYNTAVDQSSLRPELRITFQVYKDGELYRQTIDSEGRSTQFFSGQRVVILQNFDLQDFESGKYELRIKLEDLLADKEIKVSRVFNVKG